MSGLTRIQGSGVNAISPQDITLSPIPQPGHLLIATVGTATDNATFTSVVLDPAGINVAFTNVFNDGGASNTVPNSMWYLVVTSVPGTGLVRSTTSAQSHFNVAEFNSPNLTTPTDGFQRAANQSTATSGDSGTGVLTTNAHDLLIGGLQNDGNVTAITAGNNDNSGTYIISSTTTRSALLYFITYVTATYDAKATWTTSTIWSLSCGAFQGVLTADWNNYEHSDASSTNAGVISVTEKIR